MPILFAIVLFGGFFDLFSRRIPNWLTFPSILVGLIAQFWLAGLSGLGAGSLGMLTGFLLFFPLFYLGYMGAGDVKLFMAVGAFSSALICGWVAFVAVVIGGVYAAFDVVFRGRLKVVFVNSFKFLRSLLVPGLVPEKLKLDEERKFPFGLCIAAGVAIVIYLQNRGMIS